MGSRAGEAGQAQEVRLESYGDATVPNGDPKYKSKIHRQRRKVQGEARRLVNGSRGLL